jgi:hypothetical protein
MPPGDAGPETTRRGVPAAPAGLDAAGAGAPPRTSHGKPDLLASSLRRLTGGRWSSWLLLVVLFPLSVYGWAPDGLLESWYAPVHVLWAVACGAALYCRVPRSAGRDCRVPRSTGRYGRYCAGFPTLLLVAGVYGVAALVSWRARGWLVHPDRWPGPGAGHPDLGPLDALAFLAALVVLGALWLRSLGGVRSGGGVLTNEGGSPC